MTRRQGAARAPKAPEKAKRGSKSKEELVAEWRQSPPELPWTVDVAAAVWGLSEPRVRVLCEQGRVAHVKRGQLNTILVMQREAPPKAAPGTLTAEQRAVKHYRKATP